MSVRTRERVTCPSNIIFLCANSFKKSQLHVSVIHVNLSLHYVPSCLANFRIQCSVSGLMVSFLVDREVLLVALCN